MSFWTFLQGQLLGGKTIEVSAGTIEKFIDSEKFSRLVTEEFAIHAAINLIANCISKCEFRTFLDGTEVHGDEYYRWNYSPNKNQNASQFIQELVTKMLYENESVVVDAAGQMLIAQSYTKEEYALNETVFSGVSRNGFTFSMRHYMSDVLYFQLSNTNIKGILKNVCNGYNALLNEAVEKYEKAGGEKGTLNIEAPASGKKYGTKTFEEVYEELMNNRFKKFFGSKNAVLPLFSGFSYTKQAAEQSKKSTSELKDITDITNEIFERVAQAFNIPKALLKGDVAEVKEITKNFLTFCVDPICTMLEKEINRKRSGKEVLKGTYLKIDATSVMHTDVFDIAVSADKLIASGMYCVDELRKKVGDEELKTEESTRHYITKNYTALETTKGGETSEE